MESTPAGLQSASEQRERASNPQREMLVAVVGNPNTGKTTLFNALTGLSQHTGNYPGVTVECALGRFRVGGQTFLAADLPGVYSLAPRSPDELLAVEALLGWGGAARRPDLILCVVDASNLDRNLYLVTQVLELGVPVVVALTMVDVAERKGLRVDVTLLESCLGVPVVPVVAHRRRGIGALLAAVAEAARQGRPPVRCVRFPPELEEAIAEIQSGLALNGEGPAVRRFLAERLLVDEGGLVERELARAFGPAVTELAEAARRKLTSRRGRPGPLEIDSRYEWIERVCGEVLRGAEARALTWTDRIDAVVTHPVWGLLIFVCAMAVTFQAIFSWAVPVMDAIDGAVQALGAAVSGWLPEGPLRSLMVDGVIGGVGAVVVFVPQIAVLFALITVLEDSGYMARAAFLMDRLMAGFGLSGRSFIPLLSSFACAVPGIMSTRTIEDRRDRLATILIAPLMSCSARLPVYVLLISAFVPPATVAGIFGLQGLTLFAMYCVGLLVAPPVAWLLKRTYLRGAPVPFVLEMPPYKVPSWRVVLFRMYDRSWAFVRRAGTIILATTVLVWAASYYPRDADVARRYENLRAAATTAAERSRLEAEEAALQLRASALGRAGRAIEPLVTPLGWDWKIGMATLASFPAREVVIAALGTIYSVGDEVDEESGELRQALRAARRPDGSPVFTLPVALSLMVFFALCCQCAATLATIRRETGSWGYAVFTFAYMTTLAYLGALLTYQVGVRVLGS